MSTSIITEVCKKNKQGQTIMTASRTIWFINQYASTPGTGMGGRHYHLARELVLQGHTVYVVTSSHTHLLRRPPKLVKDYKIEKNEGINYVWLRGLAYKDAHDKRRILNWFSFTWKLRKLTRIIKDTPDTIICSSPSLVSFLGARYLSWRLKSHLFFEVRDIWPLTLIELGGYSKQHVFIRFLQWIEDTAYQRSDVVLSNLPNAVEHMVARGMRREKFAWIPNGFSLSEVEQSQPLLQQVMNRLPKDKFVIGYTGTVGAANALDVLIKAGEMINENKEIFIVIVGDGREKIKLKELVKSRNLTNIIFIDSIPKTQIQSMLALFDVCYIGLTKDPLFRFGVSPNKLFDYFYAAKPIIYAIDSDMSLVDVAKAGVSVPAENPQAVAQAISELYYLSPKERVKIGANGHNYVLANHEYGMLARKLSDLLA